MTTYQEKRDVLLAALPRNADGEGFIEAIIAHDPKFYFKDGLVGEMAAHGYPVLAATKAWALDYEGSNTFVQDVARKLNTGKIPSVKQARALLNCAMKDAQEKSTRSSGDSDVTIVTLLEPKHPCFVCGEKFHSPTEAGLHRTTAHRGAAALEPDKAPVARKDDWETAIRECRACDFKGIKAELREHRKEHYKPLFDGVPQSGLDLTTIPEGRYAVPDLSGTDYYFLSIQKVHKTKTRSKKFRYGWVTYGEEEVAAGTLEVRQWSGETKELIGEQRPGETYRGNHIPEWELILKDPVASTKLFGVIHKRCGRCGTSLTDPESRRRAIGPECIKHYTDPSVMGDAGSKEDLTARLMKLRGATTPTAFIKPSPYKMAEKLTTIHEAPPPPPKLTPAVGWDQLTF